MYSFEFVLIKGLSKKNVIYSKYKRITKGGKMSGLEILAVAAIAYWLLTK